MFKTSKGMANVFFTKWVCLFGHKFKNNDSKYFKYLYSNYTIYVSKKYKLKIFLILWSLKQNLSLLCAIKT